jgi:glycine betaine/proline transport system substrate-binding protein
MLKLRKLGMLLVVVLLTVSVSSCKDSDKKKEEGEKKKKLSIFIPIGLKDCVHYLAKVALESDGYDVTLLTWRQD